MILAGHGRPLLYATQRPGSIDSELVFQACVRTYEFLAEDSHSPYLAELVETCPDREDIKNRLCSKVARTRNERTKSQLLDVLSVFASQGHARSKRCLRVAVYKDLEKGCAEYVRELLQGNQKPGLVFLLKALDNLPSDLFTSDTLNEMYWKVVSYVPKNRGEKYLHELRTTFASAGRLIEAGELRKSSEPPRKFETAEQLINGWNSGYRQRRGLEQFSKIANQDEFVKAAQRIGDIQVEADWYLRWLFKERPYPLDPSTLFPLCLGKDGRLAGAAFGILKKTVSPQVRAFGMKQMSTIRNGSLAVDLVAVNYKPGDQERIKKRADIAKWGRDLHQTLGTLRDLIEEHPEIDPSYTDYMYERVPCCTCRYWVVKRLINRKQFDRTRAEECLYDADFSTRALARKFLRKSSPRLSD